MNWKFWERGPVETRQATNYSDALLASLLSDADGDDKPSSPAIGEVISGLWARAFASAEVSPDTPATRALTPAVLSTTGRQLAERGEVVFVIEVAGGMVKLLPVNTWVITGGYNWMYEVSIPQPSQIVTRHLPADAVVHLQYDLDIAQPWLSGGPMQRGNTTAELNARLERGMSEEASGSVGYVLPAPQSAVDSKLQQDIQKLQGRTSLVPTTQGDMEDASPPKQDWQPQRLGADFPAGNIVLRRDTGDSLAAASGVPPALIRADSDATASREAYRQFVSSTIKPIARVITGELRDKLDTPDLTLTFDSLASADVQSRARSYASFVQAGMAPDRAEELSGLKEIM